MAPTNARAYLVLAAAAIAAVGAALAVVVGPSAAGAAQPAATRGLYLGELVGRDAKVAIVGSADGARYDIRAMDGTIIAAGLTAAQVASLLPGQDPRGVAGQDRPISGPLMLADPEHPGRE